MGIFLATCILVGLMLFGVPVAFSFAAMTIALSLAYSVNFQGLMVTGFWSLNSVVLLALPFFILTGYLMQGGGLAKRLISFIDSIVGKIPGGLGMSMILTAGVFGAISGSATSAVASIGKVMIKPMELRGYSRRYTSALLGVSSLLGILIPPSITMILFAAVTRQSIAACFACTIGPGILLIIGLSIANAFLYKHYSKEEQSRISNFHQNTESARISFLKSTVSAIPALLVPVIILGAIYGGFSTPTEAAAVAVLASFIVGFFIYRDLTFTDFLRSTAEAAETTGILIIILLFSLVAGRIMIMERIPQELTELVRRTLHEPWIVLLGVNAFLVLAGMIMDDISVTLIIAPLLLPLMVDNGVQPIHFAAIVGTSVVIGANSPPTAPILYMACHIGEVEINKTVGPAVALMLLVALPVTLLTTFIPEISLSIPRALGLL